MCWSSPLARRAKMSGFASIWPNSTSPVSIGIGGTLNFLAGKIRRAPQWMQDFGLEWLYRVVQEPGRLWKRYLLEDLPIFFQLLAQARVTPNEALTEEAPAFSHRFAITADATPVSVELTPR